MLDINLLLEGFRKGSAQGAAGSGLSRKLLQGKTIEEVLANPIMQSPLEYIKTAKEEFRNKPILSIPFSLYKLFDTTGDRKLYQAAFFDHRTRLIVYSVASWLWGKGEDIHALEDIIWAICDEYTWCLPAHLLNKSLTPRAWAAYNFGILKDNGFSNEHRIDLAASETGFALAECCAMLEGVLSPVVVDRARQEINRRVIRSYVEYGSIQRWETMNNNWNAVVAGSVSSAAMYLVEDDSYLAGIIYRLQATMDRFLASFPDDGSSLEGLSYWNYGVGFYVYFADLLYHRTAGSIDLFSDPKFHSIARFQQQCYFPYGATIQFSDMNNIGYDMGLAHYLAKCYEDVRVPPTEFAFKLCAKERGRLPTTIRDLLWTDQKVCKEFNPPPCTVFPEAQWLLCRTGEVGLAAKGGHNADSHNHNDVGSFHYFKHGKMMLCDLGRGEYTRQYFGPERYNHFIVQSLGHNVPVVNNQGQQTGREFCTKECKITADGEMTIEFAAAYGIKELKRLERNYKFDRQSGSLKIKDTFVLSESIPIAERFISCIKPRVKENTVIIGEDGITVELKCEQKITPEVKEVIYKNFPGEEVKAYTVDFIFSTPDSNLETEFIIM